MNPEKTPKVSRDPDALLYTAEQVANHPLVKGNKALVYAVRKAAKTTGDSPFTGRMTTARKFKDWISNHPEFVPTHWLRKKKQPAAQSSHTSQPVAA